ncbi:MAG TPA: glycosyltransferase [Ignavibacteriales bacterium]|nr:glycosyltransferase [Ignavibacteriales bacterium]HOL81503.1 glycosyltransferase [Ignavibacteriales bacterium]HOM65401.1 glycosyltransferase [Ignavibacteriales bacterium]HPD67030.1 glycosyltransferase [Ignavibacteriales bacterium]HPP33570.1 glycosyltransferase [Ignavibacteriales bacterium]
MKVLFFYGAMPHYLVPVLNRLSEHIEVYVCIPEVKSKTVGDGVKTVDNGFKFNVMYSKEYITYYKKVFIKNIYTILQDVKPDVIVLGWPYILSIVLYPKFYFFLKKNKIKIVFRDIPFQVPKFLEPLNIFNKFIIIDENNNQKIYKGISKISLFFLNLIRLIYVNIADIHLYYSSVGFDIYKTYFFKKEKMFLLSNSPDTDKLNEVYEKLVKQNLQVINNSIIHVGRLIKWKKVDLLIKAVKKLKDKYPDIKLRIIGDGPEKNNLIKLVDDLQLNDNVEFLGAIYDSEKLGYYLITSQIYVIAGIGGLSINEAMVFGKPIICSVCDGTEKDLVFEDFNGKYFEVDNENDLVDKIDYLLQNKDLIENFGNNSRKIILEKVNINKLVENYLIAFNSIKNENINNK